MADEIKGQEVKVEGIEAGQKTRRSFVKTAAQVAVTAPAVGLLLSGQAKAQQSDPYTASANHILDDFTTGNEHEDIDACRGTGLTLDDTLGGPGCLGTPS